MAAKDAMAKRVGGAVLRIFMRRKNLEATAAAAMSRKFELVHGEAGAGAGVEAKRHTVALGTVNVMTSMAAIHTGMMVEIFVHKAITIVVPGTITAVMVTVTSGTMGTLPV